MIKGLLKVALGADPGTPLPLAIDAVDSTRTRDAEEYPLFRPDPLLEAVCRERLVRLLVAKGQHHVEENVEQLFSLQSGVCDRFDYFSPRMPASARRRLLVSGCAAGSELIIGRRYGFQQVCGTDVDAELVGIARERLAGAPGFEIVHYDGRRVPYEDRSFTAVVSGHIIEHTPSPFAYFKEHLRVLAPGGWFFLEFPNRYHRVELHTGLPSLEYLPDPLRALALRYRASRFSRYSPEQRRRYADVLNTLRPVSRWQIALFLLFSGIPRARVAHAYAPLPGYVRMLIEKHA